MTDTFRAMCAELAEAYAWCIEEYMTAPAEEDNLIQRARALLAQPEPEGGWLLGGLTLDEELQQMLFDNYREDIELLCDTEEEARLIIRNHVKFARAAIAADRARRPTPQPEPEGLTDDKLMDIARATDLVYCMGKGRGFASPYMEGTDITEEVLAYARHILQRYRFNSRRQA